MEALIGDLGLAYRVSPPCFHKIAVDPGRTKHRCYGANISATFLHLVLSAKQLRRAIQKSSVDEFRRQETPLRRTAKNGREVLSGNAGRWRGILTLRHVQSITLARTPMTKCGTPLETVDISDMIRNGSVPRKRLV